MIGFSFSEYIEEEKNQTPFERLLKIFLELITHTSGDFEEAFRWLEQLDDEYGLTTPEYTLEDFRRDLEEKRYIKKDGQQTVLSGKGEQLIRQRALEQIFGKLKKGKAGNHLSNKVGSGEEQTEGSRPYQFGDNMDQINFVDSFRNAQIKHGLDNFQIDRKSTRLNSSHVRISYAVFCLKKKKCFER